MDGLKKRIKRNATLVAFLNKVRFSWLTRGLRINNCGTIRRLKKYVVGKNNIMNVGDGSLLDGCTIHIVGENNEITFGKNCKVRKGNSFWMEGNDIKIYVGDNTTFNISNHINAQEDGVEIHIGEDCRFSNNVHIRTSDAHPIYDKDTKKRLNPARNVYLGKHVWIAPQSAIYKGVHVGDGSIIASRSLVTHDVPENVIVAGLPAKIVKENVFWTREDIILKKK